MDQKVAEDLYLTWVLTLCPLRDFCVRWFMIVSCEAPFNLCIAPVPSKSKASRRSSYFSKLCSHPLDDNLKPSGFDLANVPTGKGWSGRGRDTSERWRLPSEVKQGQSQRDRVKTRPFKKRGRPKRLRRRSQTHVWPHVWSLPPLDRGGKLNRHEFDFYPLTETRQRPTDKIPSPFHMWREAPSEQVDAPSVFIRNHRERRGGERTLVNKDPDAFIQHVPQISIIITHNTEKIKEQRGDGDQGGGRKPSMANPAYVCGPSEKVHHDELSNAAGLPPLNESEPICVCVCVWMNVAIFFTIFRIKKMYHTGWKFHGSLQEVGNLYTVISGWDQWG